MSLKTKLTLALACLVILVLLPTFSLAAGNEAIVNGVAYTNFMEAVEAADGTSYPVEVYGTMTVSGNFPNNVEVKIIGKTADATLDLGNTKHVAQDGGILAFENIKLTKASVNYTGFHHAAKETYTNCTIEGEYWAYGTEAEFTNCTFIQTNPDKYNMWVYGASKTTLTNCTFQFASKSVLFYNDGNNKDYVLNVNNCTFITENYVTSDKAAIEIDSSVIGTYTLNIKNSKVDCVLIPNGEEGMWRHKKGEKLTVSESGSALLHNDTCDHVPAATPGVVMTPSPTAVPKPPVSGDNTPITLAFVMMMLSCGAIVLLAKNRNRKMN